MPEYAGLKLTQDQRVSTQPPGWGIRRVRADWNNDRLNVGEFGRISWGGNSGFQALSLAIQFGVRKIVLVGFDMRTDRGLHWHEDYPAGMNNPSAKTTARWRQVMDEAAPMVKALGVLVLNASPVSALTAYPKVDFSEALGGAGT